MIFSEKLQIIRKSKGMTQEKLAENLNVSRQAVAKWEAGQAYPDINNLIQISNLFHVTVDYLVKDQECMVDLTADFNPDIDKLIRGPEYYQSGEYTYKCNVVGDFRWFQGHEEIYRSSEKVYECCFHGGITK